MGFSDDSDSKESACIAGGTGLIPGEGNGNPLQYSCLDNSTDRGDWQAKIHGVTKSQTWLIHWKQQQQSINDHLQASEVSQGKLILRSARAESKSAVYSCTLESPGFSLASSRAKIFLPCINTRCLDLFKMLSTYFGQAVERAACN